MTDPTSEYRDSRPQGACCPLCGEDLPEFEREAERLAALEESHTRLCEALQRAINHLRHATDHMQARGLVGYGREVFALEIDLQRARLDAGGAARVP